MGGGKGGGKGGKRFAESGKVAEERRKRMLAVEKIFEEGGTSTWPSRAPNSIPLLRSPTEPHPHAAHEAPETAEALKAKWVCSAMWGRAEEGFPQSVYFDSSQRATEVRRWNKRKQAPSCWLYLKKIMQDMPGGGCPPTAGTPPATWPTPGGRGLWKHYFPQELLVDDVEGYVRSLGRKRRRIGKGNRGQGAARKGVDDEGEEAEEAEESDADDDYKHDHYADEDKSESDGPDVDSGGEL